MDYGGAMNQVETGRARGGCAGEDGSSRPRRSGTGHKRRVPMDRNAGDASQNETGVPIWFGRAPGQSGRGQPRSGGCKWLTLEVLQDMGAPQRPRRRMIACAGCGGHVT